MPRKKTIFSRMGGKFRLRGKIVSLMPSDYRVYVEPFVGSGQVFLELEPDPSVLYVLNDKNKDIYDIWRDIQRVSARDIRAFDFTGSPRRFEELLRSRPTDPAHRLFRNLYLSYYSFSGLRVKYAPKPVKKGSHFIRDAAYFKQKLRGVRVLNKDYKDVVARYDCPDAFFYLDPPYPGMERYYEGQSVDPYELARTCRGIRGRFLLSYDTSPIVRDAFRGFFFRRVRVPYTSGLGGKTRYEYLISNYELS